MLLTNSLTVEERLSVSRLIGHDFMSVYSDANTVYSNIVTGRKDDWNKVSTKLELMRDIGIIIDDLQQGSTLHLETGVSNMHRFNPELLAHFCEGLNCLNNGRVGISRDYSLPEFYSFKPLLKVALHNLIRNGLRAQGSRGKVILYVNRVKKFPDSADFIPDGARRINNYVAFRVASSSEFSSDKSFAERLQTCPSLTNEHGFGLYFVGLAARVMLAPVKMSKEPQLGTVISIYHPIYDAGAQK